MTLLDRQPPTCALDGAESPSRLDTMHLDESTIRAKVRDVFSLDLRSWAISPLKSGVTNQVYRIDGVGSRLGRSAEWSLVLKCSKNEASFGDPYAGAREPEVYRSHYFSNRELPLGVPRSFGVEDHADGSTWIWLEDVSSGCVDDWLTQDFEIAALDIGRFQGLLLNQDLLPAWSWLGPQNVDDHLRIYNPATMRSGLNLLQSAYGFSSALCDGVLRIRDYSSRLHEVLHRLPRTLCHYDADRRNLFLRRETAGIRTIAVDWAWSGLGPIGGDLPHLVWGSWLWSTTSVHDPIQIEDSVVRGYSSGLSEFGLAASQHSVRTGYMAMSALTFGFLCIPLAEKVLSSESGRTGLESQLGQSIESIVERLKTVTTHQVKLAEMAIHR